VGTWLDAHRPATYTPGILHGDYHLSNVMFAPDGPELVAIVDWEMCTIGDPLLDLGWLLATWPDPRASDEGQAAAMVAGAMAQHTHLPRRDELIAHYAERTTRDMSAITWYAVLACYKLGIVLEGTHARACAGKAPKPIGDMLHATTLGLFARAHAFIAAA
jgi:aminoglycoside phosphotransferase (APT) family kinase protein